MEYGIAAVAGGSVTSGNVSGGSNTNVNTDANGNTTASPEVSPTTGTVEGSNDNPNTAAVSEGAGSKIGNFFKKIWKFLIGKK